MRRLGHPGLSWLVPYLSPRDQSAHHSAHRSRSSRVCVRSDSSGSGSTGSPTYSRISSANFRSRAFVSCTRSPNFLEERVLSSNSSAAAWLCQFQRIASEPSFLLRREVRTRYAPRAMDERGPPAILAAMTDHQAELRSLLDCYEPAMLATRPAIGVWSAIENIRHLLFAEQGHLGRFVPGGLGLSPMGMLNQGLQRQKKMIATIVGTNPTTDLTTVFDEWERVHAAACVGLDLSRPELALRIRASFRHQQTHGTLAIRAVRRVCAEGGDAAHGPSSIRR